MDDLEFELTAAHQLPDEKKREFLDAQIEAMQTTIYRSLVDKAVARHMIELAKEDRKNPGTVEAQRAKKIIAVSETKLDEADTAIIQYIEGINVLAGLREQLQAEVE